jgi:uncharacterized membrane protein YhaH (DUF805 family)
MHFISSYALSHGRIARGTWVFRLVALSVTCTAFGTLAESLAGSSGAALFAVLFLWCAGAVSIQRLHDIGRSGMSLFVLVIPIVGPLMLLFQLTRRGVDGRNRHGDDPAARLDYLRVDITK